MSNGQHNTAATDETLDLTSKGTTDETLKVGTSFGGAAETLIPVHKKDHPGSILIGSMTGRVQPTKDDDEAPEWAEGLQVAILAERSQFYTRALGADKFTEAMHLPEAFAFEDLAWVSRDPETGDEMTIDADGEFRMEVTNTFTVGEIDTAIHGTLDDSVEVAAGAVDTLDLTTESYRTAEELKALEDSHEEAEKAFRSGTQG